MEGHKVANLLCCCGSAYFFDTGADKNKKESVVNIVGSQRGTLVAANLLLAFGFAGLICVALVAGNIRSKLLLLCPVMCIRQRILHHYLMKRLIVPSFSSKLPRRQGLGDPLCFASFGHFDTTTFYLLQITSSITDHYYSLTTTIFSGSFLVDYTTILFCSHFHQVEGDRAFGKFSPLVRIGKKAGSEVVKISVVALYCALFVLSLGNALLLASTVLCALTLRMGNMVVRYMEDNYRSFELCKHLWSTESLVSAVG